MVQQLQLLFRLSFTTESVANRFLYLTRTRLPDPNPALLGPAGGPFEEGGTVVYTSAISNFSASTPDVNLSGVTADFYIDPKIL